MPLTKSDLLLRGSCIALITIVWISSFLFGLYILAFYVAALTDNDLARWNTVLSGIYIPNRPGATAGIGGHFAAGGIILMLGSIQLIEGVRTRYPRLHRWIGRFYVGASLVAAIGGLVFIAISGTVGGTVMDIGFTLYGLLMLLAAIETFRHAKAGRFTVHQAWAWRLYALAIGSWLYRMDYGFWIILTDGLGHTRDFNGPFDQVMAFFFYVPNLLVVELLIRARHIASSTRVKLVASGVLILAVVFLSIGTYFFTREFWGPAIMGRPII